MKSDRRFYVYVLCDPRKKGSRVYGKYTFPCQPFYVGRGTRSRCSMHTGPSRLIDESYKTRYIKKLLAAGLRPVIVKVKDGLVFERANALERKIIRLIGRDQLTNLTDGGAGINGFRLSKAARRKIGASNRRRCLPGVGKAISEGRKRLFADPIRGALALANNRTAHLGKTQSDETRRKRSKTMTGRTHTEETKAKIRAAHLGRVRSAEYRQNISQAKQGTVRVYNADGTWNYVHTTSRRRPRASA